MVHGYSGIICMFDEGSFPGWIEERNQERSRNSQGKTGACAVSFDRRPLQCYQIEASEWSDACTCTHMHTHTQCLSFPLFSLVCFPSRDELLADRTGPLGILLSPSTADRLKGPDSYAEIPAVPGKSFPISHQIPYLGRRKKSEWGSKKGEWKAGSTPSES